MSIQKTIYPANTQIQINPDDSGTNIQSFLQKDNLRIVRQDPTNTVGINVSLSVDSSEPNLLLSKGDVDGNTPLSQTLLQSTASYINSVNNENADVQLYSTSATTKTLDIQDPPVPYVRGCSIASNAFTIGGHYADYTDGVSNIKRVYTGFYRDATPSLGAVQATTQNGLLDPNATKLDIAVRSNLDMESNSINDLAGLNTTSGSTLNINRSGQTTNLIGNTDIPLGSKLTVGAGAITLFGGDGGNIYDTTTENNIQTRIGSNARNQIYNAFISPTLISAISITLPTVINGTYVYVYNGSSTITCSISGQSGQLITQSIAGTGSSSISIRPLQVLAFYQLDAGEGVFRNAIAGEVINGTPITSSAFTSTTLDTGSSSNALTLGGTNANAVNIGRASQTISIKAPLRDVTTIDGTIVIGESSTFSSGDLKLGRLAGGRVILQADTKASNIDTLVAGGLSLGTSTATSVIIGRANSVPLDLIGTVRVGATSGTVSAGSLGQVLCSTGASTAPIWSSISSPTQASPAFSGTRFTALIQVAFNRITITAPYVGAKYMFFLNTSVDSNNSGNTQTAFLSLAYTDGATNLAYNATTYNMVNDQAVNASGSLINTTSLAQCRSGTVTTTTQTVNPSFMYTWTGALTKSFACIFSGGVDWYMGTGYISYMRVG